jgi:hypothetical protein
VFIVTPISACPSTSMMTRSGTPLASKQQRRAPVPQVMQPEPVQASPPPQFIPPPVHVARLNWRADQGGACGAAGPASAPGSALEGPPGARRATSARAAPITKAYRSSEQFVHSGLLSLAVTGGTRAISELEAGQPRAELSGHRAADGPQVPGQLTARPEP